ncbi:MAG: KUP/HAK/KT family potassium transporter, partial [Candidatus Margulisiibacteriota bacterium]
TAINFIFLLANLYKLPHGGYWSLIISSLPLAMIITYGAVQKRIGKAMKPVAVSDFLRQYKLVYKKTNLIEGTALFLIGNATRIPKYVGKTMFMNGILYEDNVFLSIQISTDPFGVEGIFRENLAEGLRVFEIHAGYMEIFDVEKLLRNHHIHEKAIFYGMEEIVTRNFIFSIFSNIKKLTPSFVQFYKLPPSKIHGVVTVIEL